jgi:hypothetical protein
MSERGPRYEAMQAGLLTYLTGVPCKSGHIAERMTDSGSCVECRRIGDRRRYALDPQKMIERKQEHYKKNSEKMKDRRRSRYAENPDKERAVARVRSAEWRAANPSKVEAQKPLKKAYKQANPEKMAALLAKRRAAKMLRTPKWLTKDDFWMMEQAYELAKTRSDAFGFEWHVDHVVPLQGAEVSGLHVPWNLRVIPWFENVSKGNRLLEACVASQSPLDYLKSSKRSTS